MEIKMKNQGPLKYQYLHLVPMRRGNFNKTWDLPKNNLNGTKNHVFCDQDETIQPILLSDTSAHLIYG
jgi:hypothetical protein